MTALTCGAIKVQVWLEFVRHMQAGSEGTISIACGQPVSASYPGAYAELHHMTYPHFFAIRAIISVNVIGSLTITSGLESNSSREIVPETATPAVCSLNGNKHETKLTKPEPKASKFAFQSLSSFFHCIKAIPRTKRE